MIQMHSAWWKKLKSLFARSVTKAARKYPSLDRRKKPAVELLEARDLLAAGYALSLFEHSLGRIPANAELGNWAAIAATNPAIAVVNGVDRSAEARARLVQGWYALDLGRPAQGGEEQPRVEALLEVSEETIRAGLLSSAEFFARSQALSASGTPTDRYIAALYNHVLDRSPSSGELAAWASQLPAMGSFAAAKAFLDSFEYRARYVSDLYATYLERVVAPPPQEIINWVNLPKDTGTIRREFEASAEFIGRTALSAAVVDGRIQEGGSFVITVGGIPGAMAVAADLVYDGQSVMTLPQQQLSAQGIGLLRYDIPASFLPEGVPEDAFDLRIRAGSQQTTETIVITAAPRLLVNLENARIQEGKRFEVGFSAPIGSTQITADLYHDGQLIPDAFAGFKEVGPDGTATIGYNMPMNLLPGDTTPEDAYDIRFTCAGLEKTIRIVVTAAPRLLVNLSSTRIQQGSNFRVSLAEAYLDPIVGNTEISMELWHDGVRKHTFGYREVGPEGTATVTHQMPTGFLGAANEDAFDLVIKVAGLEKSVRVVLIKDPSSFTEPAVPTSIRPPKPIPKTPGPLTIAARSESQIDLSWTKAENADSYDVYRSIGSQWIKISSVGSAVSSHLISTLSVARNYFLKVASNNAAGIVTSNIGIGTTAGKAPFSQRKPQTFVFFFAGNAHAVNASSGSGLEDLRATLAADAQLQHNFNYFPVRYDNWDIDTDTRVLDAARQYVKQTLRNLVKPEDKVVMVGHSYVGHLAYRLASDLGGLGRPATALFALDPIRYNGVHFDQSGVNHALPVALQFSFTFVQRNKNQGASNLGLQGHTISGAAVTVNDAELAKGPNKTDSVDDTTHSRIDNDKSPGFDGIFDTPDDVSLGIHSYIRGVFRSKLRSN